MNIICYNVAIIIQSRIMGADGRPYYCELVASVRALRQNFRTRIIRVSVCMLPSLPIETRAGFHVRAHIRMVAASWFYKDIAGNLF